MPIITNDNPPMNEVVTDGANGLLVRGIESGTTKSGIAAYEPDVDGLAAAIEPLSRRRERPRVAPKPPPRVSLSRQAPAQVGDVVALRINPAQLVPLDRGGDRSPRPRPHRVRGDGRLGVRVAQPVKKEPPAAFLLSHLDRQPLRVPGRGGAGNIARERSAFLERRAAVEGNDE